MPLNYKPFDKDEWLRLEKKADELRRLTVQTVKWAGSGHIGGGLSCLDALTVLYHRYMKIDVNDPDWADRDRFVLSKGHAAVSYAPLLVDLGFMPLDELKIFNLTGAKIGMHLDSNKVVGVDVSTGSLGQGTSMAVGMALSGRMQNRDYMCFVLTGDGELNEGSNWEAFMAASQYELSNIVVMVDNNKLMIDGPVDKEMKVEPLDDKFAAFGFETIRVDGQNIKELCGAVEKAIDNYQSGGTKPTAIIMDTVKGAGIDFIEGDYTWHYGSMDEGRFEKAFASLDTYYQNRVARAEKEA